MFSIEAGKEGGRKNEITGTWLVGGVRRGLCKVRTDEIIDNTDYIVLVPRAYPRGSDGLLFLWDSVSVS